MAHSFLGGFPDVESLVRVLGSRRHLRASLHLDALATDNIAAIIESGGPVRVLYLWGKGKKTLPDLAEQEAIALLASYAGHVGRFWPGGLRFHFVFADTHAALNGFEEMEASRYFLDVRRTLEALPHSCGRLSDLWQESGLTWRTMHQAADAMSEDDWRRTDARLGLSEAAKKHAIRGEPEAIAKLYYVVRQRENAVLSRTFPQWFYGSSDAPARSELQPALAALHFYGIRRGRCEKPWHITMPMNDDMKEQRPGSCAA